MEARPRVMRGERAGRRAHADHAHERRRAAGARCAAPARRPCWSSRCHSRPGRRPRPRSCRACAGTSDSPLAGVKTISLAESVMALERGAARGADEALLLNRAGNLCEATTANVFLVRDGGRDAVRSTRAAWPGSPAARTRALRGPGRCRHSRRASRGSAAAGRRGLPDLVHPRDPAARGARRPPGGHGVPAGRETDGPPGDVPTARWSLAQLDAEQLLEPARGSRRRRGAARPSCRRPPRPRSSRAGRPRTRIARGSRPDPLGAQLGRSRGCGL